MRRSGKTAKKKKKKKIKLKANKQKKNTKAKKNFELTGYEKRRSFYNFLNKLFLIHFTIKKKSINFRTKIYSKKFFGFFFFFFFDLIMMYIFFRKLIDFFSNDKHIFFLFLFFFGRQAGEKDTAWDFVLRPFFPVSI